MSELISGKEAFNSAMDGKTVFWRHINQNNWSEWSRHTAWCIDALEHDEYQFKLKPTTITVNGIEVPAPFEPKEGDMVWFISDDHTNGYSSVMFENLAGFQFGAWRTEEEIKQVVVALRSIFNAK